MAFAHVAVAGLIAAGMFASFARADDNAAGIGVELAREQSGAYVVGRVLVDGPAAKAGIVVGDRIVAVSGVDVRQFSEEAVGSLIRGERGSEVKLTIASADGKSREVSVVRDVIAPPQQGQQQGPQPGPNQPQQPQAPAAAGRAMRLQIVTVPDPKVDNIPALTALIPAGWQLQGGPMWMPDTSMAACLRMRAADPQSGLSAEWLPVQSFTYVRGQQWQLKPGTNYQGRIFLEPIGDPATFISTFYGQVMPELQGAQVVAAQDYAGPAQLAVQQMQAARVPGQPSARSSRVRYAYTVQNQPYEADVFLTLSYTDTGAGVMWDVTDAFVARGPKGSLDANTPLFEAVRQNCRMTPQWLASLQLVRQAFSKGIRDWQQDQQAMSQLLAQSRAHTQQVAQQIAADRDRAEQGRQEAFREVLAGVETYADPVSGQNVWMPAGYKDYWVNPKGEYLLNDQAGTDPNQGSTENWTKMQRMDPMAR